MRDPIEVLAYLIGGLLIVYTATYLTRQIWRGLLAIPLALLDIEERRIDNERKRQDTKLIYMTTHTQPVSRDLVESGLIAQQQLRLLLEEIMTHRPPDNVPHTVRIDHRPMLPSTTAISADATPAHQTHKDPPPPTFIDLFSAGKLPPNAFLMGYGLDDGKPITATWKQLYSALIGGLPGTGKSTLIRCVLAQAALQGGRFMVIDPHYGAGEESLGASLEPLQHLMLSAVAVTPPEILATIHRLHGIGQRRITGQDEDRTPLILIADETTALLSRSSIAGQLSDLLAEIAQEMRKVSIYAMCIGQQFRADIMDSTIRNSFVSMLSCRTRREVARVMSGNNDFAKAAESLKRGQAVWLDTDGNMIRIAVPNTTHQHMIAIAGYLQPGEQTHRQPDITDPPARQQETLPPQDATAIEMFRNGANLKTIITTAYQATTGAPYTDAVQRFMSILRSQLP